MQNTKTIDQVQETLRNYSLQELAKLSLEERYKILLPIIQEIAEDVNNDPDLNLFSELEGEGLEDNED